MAVASGGVDGCHISVFHRFFSRATWSLDALGQVVFRLALAWIPVDQSLFILVDDTLARKTGKGVALATMHHVTPSTMSPNWMCVQIWLCAPMPTLSSMTRPPIESSTQLPPIQQFRPISSGSSPWPNEYAWSLL